MGLVRTRAILLRAHAYGEGSRILRFLTEDLGLVGVMARGVRRSGARGDGGLSTFAEGILGLHVKPTRELQTFADFAPERERRGLSRDLARLGGASLLAEIVLRSGGEDPGPVLFHRLSNGLDRVEAMPDERLLARILAEAWALTTALGFAPSLETCARCEAALGEQETGRFVHAAGGILCETCGATSAGPRVGPGARTQLRALAAGDDVALGRPRAHLRLLEDFLIHHLHLTTPLQTFRFLEPLAGDQESELGS